ncbi:hypothetical protein [Proteus sp. CD3]|uniref:hypothetical protein n=1 Tax=Proteus sp. CD3 TaxID=1921565 RepID=UPI00124A3248|nr:hypothetical protein [Proteus sp. CD3]QEZ91106.1 hypothetical protein BTA34_01550 [Proteus sp. CD3]
MGNKFIFPMVGNATQTCFIPEPCFLDLTVKNNKNGDVFLAWKGECSTLPVTIVDDGDDVLLDIIINEKHPHPIDTHKVIISSKNFEQELTVGKNNTINVSYNPYNDVEEFDAEKLLDTFINTMLPIDAFKEPRKYIIEGENCLNSIRDWSFNVVPSIKFGFSIIFKYGFSSRTETIKERRDKQINRLREERLNGGPGNRTLPRDLNRYRSGWNLIPAAFVRTDTFGIGVDFFYELAGKSYSLKPISHEKKINRVFDKLSGIVKVGQIINDIENKFFYGKRNARSEINSNFPIFSFDFSDVEIGLTFFTENMPYKEERKLVCAIEGKPLWGGSFKIDILQVMALYCGKLGDEFVRKIRAALKEKNESQDKFSLGLNIDIIFFFEIHCFVGMAQTPENIREFAFDGDNKFDMGIRGEAGAYIKANVLFMEACLSFYTLFETKGSFVLDSHENGIDLVFCHDGIIIKCQFKGDISINGSKESIYDATPIDNEWEIYPVSDPLMLENSDIRFNLTGEKRHMPDRIKPLESEILGSKRIE